MGRPRTITRRLSVKVELHQVDLMQVVHNSQYFRWFEMGRLAILDELMPVSWQVEQMMAMPVVTNHCQYLWPAGYGDELVVTTRHRMLPTWEGRFRFDHSVSNQKTKQELARGWAEVTLVDLRDKKPVRAISQEIWRLYQQLK